MVRGDGPPEKGERKMENRKREDFNKNKGKIKKTHNASKSCILRY